MFKPKYSVGYNFDYDNFVGLIEKYKEHIESVYFPPPKKLLGSGRIIDEPQSYKNDIISLIKKCNELGITPYMILNSTIVASSQIDSVIEYTKDLHKKASLAHVTVTDPYLITQIKKDIPNMFIEASTLCRIQKVQEAKYFKEIGVSRMTSDRETIRDIPVLKKLAEVLPLRVLANEGCIKNCIYKYAHYNMLSANVEEKPILPFGKKFDRVKNATNEMDTLCVSTVGKHPHKVFSSPFIRPEDIKRYEGVTDIFKLSTRNFETDRIEKTLIAYIAQEYDGNLVDILNTAYIEGVFEYIDNKALNNVPFFEMLSTCDDDCDKCRFCHGLLVKTKARMRAKS